MQKQTSCGISGNEAEVIRVQLIDLHSQGLQLNEEVLFKVSLDGDILAHPLPPPGLYHKLSGKLLWSCWLKRSEFNSLVKGISRHNLPVVEG